MTRSTSSSRRWPKSMTFTPKSKFPEWHESARWPNVVTEWLIDSLFALIEYPLGLSFSSCAFSLMLEGWRLCSDGGLLSSRPSWCVRTNPAVSAITSWLMFSPCNTQRVTPAAHTSMDSLPPSGKLRNNQGEVQSRAFIWCNIGFLPNVIRVAITIHFFPPKYQISLLMLNYSNITFLFFLWFEPLLS